MVLNVCLPHFQTSIHCNKLSADGYDVSNLLSSDPSLRRNGFKLEYFLGPPLQVTLCFRFSLDLSRLDLDLWPWASDQNRRSRRIEIFVSAEKDGDGFQLVSRCDLQEELRVCVVNPAFRPRLNSLFSDPSPVAPVRPVNFWGVKNLGSVFRLRICIPFSAAPSALGIRALAVWASPSRFCSDSEIRMIQEAHLNSLEINPQNSGSKKSSDVVLADKITWNNLRREPQPSRITLDEDNAEHSRIRSGSVTGFSRNSIDNTDASLDNSRIQSGSVTGFSRDSINNTDAFTDSQIPEEFLDPLTQELMVLPMILPSGAIVDLSTLEEYEKREATWGRAPNDPFTGVPFAPGSTPLPNPLLKTRIDRMILQTGSTALGAGENLRTEPQPSRLTLDENNAGHSRIRSGFSRNSIDNIGASLESSQIRSGSATGSRRNSIDNTYANSRIRSGSITGFSRNSNDNTDTSTENSRIRSRSITGFSRNSNNNTNASLENSRIQSRPVTGFNRNSKNSNTNASSENSTFQSGSITGFSRHSNGTDTSQSRIQSKSVSDSKSGATLIHSAKRKRDASFPFTSVDPDHSPPRKTHQTPSVSHERRLELSLDEALNAALHGLPVFTAQSQSSSCVSAINAQHTCVFCSCSLTVFSSSVPSYSLPCTHLMCGPCLREKHTPDSQKLRITCPVCGSSASSRDVTRVHH